MAVTSQASQSSDDSPKGWSAFEHHIEQSAEYLLILTFAVMFWMAGFVNLFTHASGSGEVLGLYSWPFFILLAVYASGFALWGMFLFRAKGIDRFKRIISFIQTRAWLGISVLLVFAAMIASMYIFGERWIQFPLLQISILMLILLFTGVILFAKPNPDNKMERWRKVIIGFVVITVGIELVLQAGALLRISPVDNLNGLFTPYGRVYSPSEGGSNGFTNANGWYYPDFRLEEGSPRYVLVGGSYLMGLQVEPLQNMGVVLDQLMNVDDATPREVISMGTPDYGLQVFLHERIFPFTVGQVQPEEVIVVFHVLNDFQALEAPNGVVPFVIMDDAGVVDVPGDEYLLRHDLWHTVIRGYDPPNPAQTLQSHLFSANLLGGVLSRATNQLAYLPDDYSNSDYVSDTQPFAGLEFLFDPNSSDPRAESTLQLATAQLEGWRAKAEAEGVKMRLVIVPYFPANFFAENSGDWSSEIDGYDLFTAERALQQWANEQNISVLPLGQYLQATELSVTDIQALFTENGIGHFNANGHRAVADAIYGCFYAEETHPAFLSAGCTNH